MYRRIIAPDSTIGGVYNPFRTRHDYEYERNGSRNRAHTTADWQFTTADARVKLKRLYPAM